MKVLVVNPPADTPQTREGRCTQSSRFWHTTWPALSVASLAGVLRAEGHETRAVDCANPVVTVERFLELVASDPPDVVVWSAGNPTADADLKLSEKIKGVDSGIRTVVFGTLVGTLPDKVMERYPDIDAIVLREPEHAVSALIREWAEGRDAPKINGIRLRAGGDGAEGGAGESFLGDLDSLPVPAWDMIGPRRYKLPLSGRPFLMAAPSRGCPYRCTFCTTESYYGTKVRERSAAHFVDELAFCKSEYGVKDFLFWSDTFTIDKGQVLDLCDEIQSRNLGIRWVCNSRTDTLDREMAREMRRAGCWLVSFGIESASADIIKTSHKLLKFDGVVETLGYTRQEGIQSTGHFIFGMPGETMETAEATIRYATGLPLDYAQFYSASPWPGSKLFDIAMESGRMTLEDVWAGISQDEAGVSVCDLSVRELNDFIRKANRVFYRRPRTIASALKQLRPRGVLPLVSSAIA